MSCSNASSFGAGYVCHRPRFAKAASGLKTALRRRSRIIPAMLLGLLATMAAPLASASDAKELFVKNCAPCHSKDGKAQTPAAKKLGVKDLSLSKLTDEHIAQQIRDGKQEKQSGSKMPAFKEKLSTEEIKSLIAVVKEFRK